MDLEKHNCNSCRHAKVCKYEKERISFNTATAYDAIRDKVNNTTPDDPGQLPPNMLPWLAIVCRYYEGKAK